MLALGIANIFSHFLNVHFEFAFGSLTIQILLCSQISEFLFDGFWIIGYDYLMVFGL